MIEEDHFRIKLKQVFKRFHVKISAGIGGQIELRYNCKSRINEWIAGISLAIFLWIESGIRLWQ